MNIIDLTFQYNQTLKANIQLKKQEAKRAASHLIGNCCFVTIFYIATLMNNEISSEDLNKVVED